MSEIADLFEQLAQAFRQDRQGTPAAPAAPITPEPEVRTFEGDTLGQKQRKFTLMVAELIQFAYSKGYELSFGDAYRDPRAFGSVGTRRYYSSANSLHKERLAVDLNLFKNGRFLTGTEDHRELGEFWESIGGAWGGRFDDGNHYSIEHNGRK